MASIFVKACAGRSMLMRKKNVLCGQNTQRQAGVKNMLYFCSNWSNSIPIFGSKQLKNHTLWGCISQGGGVAPR